MNYKSILIIALIVLVSLVALSNALHIYENGNITLEEHHDHGGDEQGHNHENNQSEEHGHNESEEHSHNERDSHNESH